MYHLIIVLIIIVSILMVLIVVVQNSKGGGLASNFSAPTQFMGVKKTADFLEKATWGLAIGLLVLSLAGSMAIPRGEGDTSRSMIEEQYKNAADPTAGSNFPTTAPQGGEATPAPAKTTGTTPTK
jgi:preprotein translocase subunit SecG